MHSFDRHLWSASWVLDPVLCIGFAVEVIPVFLQLSVGSWVKGLKGPDK